MKTYNTHTEARKAKANAIKSVRILNNETGQILVIPLDMWVNNVCFVDAPDGKYTNLGVVNN